MKLAFPFSFEVRLLYLNCWKCWLCGENGQRKGGLEIHHILGRISDSAFNSSCLCKECHSHMGHSQEEECKLFLITLKYLYDMKYQPCEKDYDFLNKNGRRLLTKEVIKFIYG